MTTQDHSISKHILVLNSGSSSFKFSVFTLDKCHLVLDGSATDLHSELATFRVSVAGVDRSTPIKNASHQDAINQLLQMLEERQITKESIAVIGHRVVHGGETFHSAALVNENTLKLIEECSELAPLHNPANLLGIQILQSTYPEVKQIVVFDTAFHQTLAPRTFLYAVPFQWYKKYSVRRYGFHGTSCRYVLQKCHDLLNLSPKDHQVLIAHMGNGCSATAIINGESVDTTMGMTPLEGAVMGTRSGDLDPGIHQYLAHQTTLNLDQITDILNEQSGLLGLSQKTNDMQTLLEDAENNDQHASLAIDVFCFRLARLLGGLVTSLSRIDALIFTGGIGENACEVRKLVIKQLAILGFFIDDQRNQEHGHKSNGVISSSSSHTILVIPTDEQKQIALDCLGFID